MATPLRPVNSRRAAALATAVVAPLALGGCSFFQAPAALRGNRVEAAQLAEITPGVQTKADVQSLLGSPSARGTFDDDNWYYISAVTRPQVGREQSVNRQRVVAIHFNDRGVVQDVRELSERDGRQVAVVSRTTPVPGNERSLLQALFGNVGALNPLGGQAAQSAPGVGNNAAGTGRQ